MNTTEITNITQPLTKNQIALWLDEQISEDKALYVIGGCAEIKQNLNILTFQKALQKLLSEMDAMGISIQMDNENPVQVFHTLSNYELPFLRFFSR